MVASPTCAPPRSSACPCSWFIAPDARAQAIRVAPPAVFAREAGPRRFSEPHLAVYFYGTNPDRA
jgi:hypothetical protein